MKTLIADYLQKQPSYLISAILLAKDGEREILEKIMGSEAAGFDILNQALYYGNTAKLFPINDYPIGISQSEGKLTKMLYRLAGLVMAGQTHFFALPVNRPSEVENYNLTKDEEKTLLDFIKLFFEDPTKTVDSGSLNAGITPAKKPVPAKR